MALKSLSSLLSAASLLTSAVAAPALMSRADNGPLVWAVIGDSWASGVAYNNDIDFDNNQGKCLRVKDAWGPQMKNDDSWVTNGQKMTFTPCAGAVFKDVTSIDNHTNPPQLDTLVDKPSLVVMSMGGNNAFFADIVNSCIYNGDPRVDYGLPFHLDTQGTGECKKNLAKADDVLSSGELADGLTKTIDAIFLHAAQNGFPSDFRLYINSYVDFFNAETDACEKWTFAPWWSRVRNRQPPLLTKELRQAFNDRVGALAQTYRGVISEYKLPAGVPPTYKVGFISTNENFAGHRFCEARHTLNDQYHSEDIWVWSLNVFSRGGETVDGPIKEANGVAYMELPGSVEQPLPPPGTNADLNKGWMSRPFHPKEDGHTAIKKAVVAKLKADRVRGVKP